MATTPKKKAASLSESLMPVEVEAEIPARVATAESTNDRKTESQNEEYVGLNFKVRPAFRRAFKTFCAEQDISQVEALAEAFELLKRARAGK